MEETTNTTPTKRYLNLSLFTVGALLFALALLFIIMFIFISGLVLNHPAPVSENTIPVTSSTTNNPIVSPAENVQVVSPPLNNEVTSPTVVPTTNSVNSSSTSSGSLD